MSTNETVIQNLHDDSTSTDSISVSTEESVDDEIEPEFSIKPKIETNTTLKEHSSQTCLDRLRKFIYGKLFDVRFNGDIELPLQWVLINAINNLVTVESNKVKNVITDSIKFASNYRGLTEWKCKLEPGKMSWLYEDYEDLPILNKTCDKLIADQYGVYTGGFNIGCMRCGAGIIQCRNCIEKPDNMLFKCKSGKFCAENENVQDRLFWRPNDEDGYDNYFNGVVIFIDTIATSNIYGDGYDMIDTHDFIAKLYDMENGKLVCKQYNITKLVKELWSLSQEMTVTKQYMINSNSRFYESIKHQDCNMTVSPNIDLHIELYLHKYMLSLFLKDDINSSKYKVRAACDICYNIIVDCNKIYGEFKSKICGTCHNRYDICEKCFDSTEKPLCCRNNTNAFGKQIKPFEQEISDQINSSHVFIYFKLIEGKCELRFYENGKLKNTKDITDVYNDILDIIANKSLIENEAEV